MATDNKNNPFKTPEGYFENFTDGLWDKLSEEKIDIPEKDGFTAPEDYFNGLHKNIQKKLDSEKPKVVQLHPYRKYYLVAASIAALVVLAIGFNWNSNEIPTFNELADTEIESYFDTNEYGFSSYEIAEMLPVNQLEIADILENQLSDENVVEYLNDNIDDFEEFNIEDYD